MKATRRPRLTARAGQQLSLEAPREGVGGYRWDAEIDPSIGSVVGRSLEPAPGVGGGATVRFTLDITGHGEGVARLSLKRPWEKDADEVIEYPITVIS
jgi:predicted secreted protein